MRRMAKTLGWLASELGGEIKGNPEIEIRRVVHPAYAEDEHDLALVYSASVASIVKERAIQTALVPMSAGRAGHPESTQSRTPARLPRTPLGDFRTTGLCGRWRSSLGRDRSDCETRRRRARGTALFRRAGLCHRRRHHAGGRRAYWCRSGNRSRLSLLFRRAASATACASGTA